MKAKKIISVFLILIFTGCFWVTAFAADQPLFLPDNGGTYVNPPSVIGGQGNTYYSGNTQSVFGSSELAASCAQSILCMHGAPGEFPAEALREAKKISEGVQQKTDGKTKRKIYQRFHQEKCPAN